MTLPFSLKYKLALGSASPRRQQLLKDAGFDFEIIKGNVDESFDSDLQAEKIPLYLSKKKADALINLVDDNTILITADTIVWLNNEALNKPENENHAKEMLRKISGNVHEVYTAVTLTNKEQQISFTDCTKVYFKKLSDNEIEFYISNYKPFDKAGAYGAQDWIGLIGIEKIEGSYFNVMGLPIEKLYKELQSFNS